MAGPRAPEPTADADYQLTDLTNTSIFRNYHEGEKKLYIVTLEEASSSLTHSIVLYFQSFQTTMTKSPVNRRTPNLSWFNPVQEPPAGTVLTGTQPNNDLPPSKNRPATIPKLFEPITLRGQTFHNRLFVSPMCQYSAD